VLKDLVVVKEQTAITPLAQQTAILPNHQVLGAGAALVV
jgi:hypothetical protein